MSTTGSDKKGRYRLVSYADAEWLEGRTAEATCPNCGFHGTVEQILEVDYHPPEWSMLYHLQLCPACTVRFVDVVPEIDYGRHELIEIGWPAYYAQMGAGTWPIDAPLAHIAKPPGAKVLEIGGAYGFGLDFCVRAKGWQGVGYDPSPLAGIGAKELDLPIIQGFFTEDTLASGPFDVIVATEVIEHLEDPPSFLRLMRQAIAADGVLMMSTPAADFIGPELEPGELYALIVPAAHLVLQSVRSMEVALRNAGFAHVQVHQERSALVAYASPAPLALQMDQSAAWQQYRAYMDERARTAPLGSDIQFGFAGRAIFEAANDRAEAAAEAAWAALNAGAKVRFGYTLEGLTALPAGAAADSLEGLGDKMPLGLGMILFGRAMQKLGNGTPRAQVRPLLALALQAVDALQAALGHRSLGEDRLSTSIADVIRLELLLCDAEAGDASALAGLQARGEIVAGWRGFVAFVNAGAFAAAAQLQADLLGAGPDALAPALRRDARLSLVNFYLAPGADASLALPVIAALAEEGEDVARLRAGVFTRLVHAGHYGQAAALAAGLPDFAALAGEEGRQARFAAIMLDVQTGRLHEAAAALQRSRASDPGLDGLYVECFVRAVNAGDMALAAALERDGIIAGALPALPQAARRDALAAGLILELSDAGSPAQVPARLQALRAGDPDETQAEALTLAAFASLAIRGHLDLARQVLPLADPLLHALRGPFTPAGRDALFAAGLLFLDSETDWRRAAASFARVRDDLVKATPAGEAPVALFWPAVRGEVLALHRLNRGGEAQTLLESLLPAYPGAPDDLVAQVHGAA